MTSDEVHQLIEQEIAGDWTLTNHHVCDLRVCLVPPILVTCENPQPGIPLTNSPLISLWLVLEEFPDEKDGYKIVYDDRRDMFGLAISGSTRPVLIGYYGTFRETYAAM
jgi:hypothetical protein